MEYPKKNAIFKEIDHTADIGLIVESNSMGGLFANAAYGMVYLLFGNRTPEARDLKKIELTEESSEELLITWLSEINYNIMVNDFALLSIRDLEIGQSGKKFHLSAKIIGGKITGPATEIKAVTYHQFYLRKIRRDCFKARIIFDI